MPYPDDVGSACPVAGCNRVAAPGMVMCATCWHRVPEDIQREVYAAWRQRQDGVREGGVRYEMAEKRHEAAKKVAIEAVERRG